MRKKKPIQNTFTYWEAQFDVRPSAIDIADHITDLLSDEGYTCHPEHVSQWRTGSRPLPVRVHRVLLREILPDLVQDIRGTNRDDIGYFDLLLRTLLP